MANDHKYSVIDQEKLKNALDEMVDQLEKEACTEEQAFIKEVKKLEKKFGG